MNALVRLRPEHADHRLQQRLVDGAEAEEDDIDDQERHHLQDAADGGGHGRADAEHRDDGAEDVGALHQLHADCGIGGQRDQGHCTLHPAVHRRRKAELVDDEVIEAVVKGRGGK